MRRPTSYNRVIDMAALGLLPEKYGAVASKWLKSGRQYAELTGADTEWGFGPFLYGPKGVDIRARLVMYRLAKQMNPGASKLEMYHFVNQLGYYTRALQGSVERSAKERLVSYDCAQRRYLSAMLFHSALFSLLRRKLAIWPHSMACLRNVSDELIELPPKCFPTVTAQPSGSTHLHDCCDPGPEHPSGIRVDPSDTNASRSQMQRGPSRG